MTTHYSLSLNPGKLSRAAKHKAAQLVYKLRDNEVPILIYRGMSGIAAATALSLALDTMGRECGMIYVRKDNEYSHGNDNYERAMPAICMGQVFVMVFVDDFCSSGRTRIYTIEAARCVAYFSELMVTVCLGNSQGLDSGVWLHTVEDGLREYGVGCPG